MQIAVGYKEKLVMYHVLLGEIKPYREMQCQGAVKCVRFSEGGQYLAAGIGNTISIYSTYQQKFFSTFSLNMSFLGHVGPVKHFSWAGNMLFSSGGDRNIYGWDMNHGARIDNLNVLRSFGECESLVVTSSRDSFKAAACTSDGKLHMLWWTGKNKDECEVVTLRIPNDDSVNAVSLNEDRQFLFAGMSSGSVRIYDWEGGPEYVKEHQQCIPQVSLHCKHLHPSNKTISRICCKGNQLITAGGIDGALTVSSLRTSHVHNNENIMHRLEIAPTMNDDIVLISTDEFEATKDLISELQEKVKTMKNDHDFSLHDKENLWKNELIELTETTDVVIHAER